MIANPFLFHQVIILPGILFGLDSLNNLLIQENEVISDIPIVVIVAKQPVMELQVLAYFFKEVCQRIRLIVLIDLLYYAAGSAVSNHIIDFPIGSFQRFNCLIIFSPGRKFFRPPRDSLDSEHLFSFQLPMKVKFESGIGRVQDTVLDVVRPATAHCKEVVSLDFVYLAPHKVYDVGTDAVYLSSVPFLNR